MRQFVVFVVLLLGFGNCQQAVVAVRQPNSLWTPYDETTEVAASASNVQERMRYRFIQSKVLDKNQVFGPLYEEVATFPIERYRAMRPWVLEQDIPTIQQHIQAGRFSYEDLVLFYLHRIYTYELSPSSSLNALIALNPKVLEEARRLDKDARGHHPIYGMPILLKDNIGTAAMKTTAGAIALMNNQTEDAFVVEQLRRKGALILGKVNLSEWANFICGVCPNGQSAVGGQTMNPYGRQIFDTGGSSSGSGAATAANYAVAAVGTETSGSILSPASQHSVVGLKPTIGLLSRSGIVPISSTLDTPGPMTKNVTDNAILLDAMLGQDPRDAKSMTLEQGFLQVATPTTRLQDLRLGVMKKLLEQDTLYAAAVAIWKEAGAQIVELEPENVALDQFLTLLNADMARDMKAYLSEEPKDKIAVPHRSVDDLLRFNLQDTALHIPYGQLRFEGVVADTTSDAQLTNIKQKLQTAGRSFFKMLETQQLDAVLSINNYHAGYAAVAEYPALTIPMGYQDSGEPKSLTFIGLPLSEARLLHIGKTFENLSRRRETPAAYLD